MFGSMRSQRAMGSCGQLEGLPLGSALGKGGIVVVLGEGGWEVQGKVKNGHKNNRATCR